MEGTGDGSWRDRSCSIHHPDYIHLVILDVAQFPQVSTARVFEMYAGATYNWNIVLSGGTTVLRFNTSWLSSYAQWEVDTPSLDAWHHIAIVYNCGGTSYDPDIYVDGALQTETENRAPGGSVNVSVTERQLGGTTRGVVQINGRLESSPFLMACWMQIRAAALAKGFAPGWRNHSFTCRWSVTGEPMSSEGLLRHLRVLGTSVLLSEGD